jgi:thioredoxin-related protein
MNIKKWVFIGVVLSLVLIGFSSADASDKIKWRSYDEGLALAKQEGKKVFIHFYADWCAYCKKMEKETLTNLSVIDSLNNDFIPVLVNSDKERDLARDFYIRGLPSTWFVSETGEKISSLPGFITAEMLLNALKFIQTDSYKTMSFKDFIKSDS